MSGWPAVLRPGDWVTFNGDEHQVVATAIGELLTGFWSTIAGMCHEWRHRWTVDETTAILETRAHYTTHAGTDVTVPCHHCLVQLKIARNATRLLGFAILIWTIPAPVVRIDIASSATRIRACRAAAACSVSPSSAERV